MNLEEIKRQLERLQRGEVFPETKIVQSGLIKNSVGLDMNYEIHLGADLYWTNECRLKWGAFNLKILDWISKNISHISDFESVCSLEDAHWDWVRKYFKFNAEDRTWFFYVVDQIPQGACLTYHPTNSVIDGKGIYYIDFLAVAPWNRKNPIEPKQFSGVGSSLLHAVNSYMKGIEGLRPGFGLHSLPKAVGFYQAIGMQKIDGHEKDGMPYFEMAEKSEFMVKI